MFLIAYNVYTVGYIEDIFSGYCQFWSRLKLDKFDCKNLFRFFYDNLPTFKYLHLFNIIHKINVEIDFGFQKIAKINVIAEVKFL